MYSLNKGSLGGTKQHTLHREPERDEFLVLACDGVWDVMSNEEICSFIGHRMKIHENLETICNEVNFSLCCNRICHPFFTFDCSDQLSGR